MENWLYHWLYEINARIDLAFSQRTGIRTGCCSHGGQCAPRGRPYPDMVLKNCKLLGVQPEQVVKVDNTIPGVEEGLRTNTWAIHLYMTGNEVGLTEDELDRLGHSERDQFLMSAKLRGEQCAHYMIPSIRELPPYLQKINELIKNGHSLVTFHRKTRRQTLTQIFHEFFCCKAQHPQIDFRPKKVAGH